MSSSLATLLLLIPDYFFSFGEILHVLCSEPQKHTVPGARENPGRCPALVDLRHGQEQAGLGDKHHCNRYQDTPPSFCNTNHFFFKANSIRESV